VNINLTLIVQMLVFVTLVWFTMKFVWPMILRPMDERSRKIALGLAAAEQGQQELVQANGRAEVIVREARERAGHIIDQAQHRANELIEQAKASASAEGQRLVAAAQQQIELDTARARDGLRRDVARIAISAASKVLEREIDPRVHADLLATLAAQV
jgi:F-type H+-transporting ATPase subunit b